MLNRLKTAAQGGSGATGDDSAGGSRVDGGGKWGRRGSGGGGGGTSRLAERDQFRVQQQGFYVRGDLTLDVFQARGLRLGTATERNPYCVVLVDRGKVGETATASKTVAPVWNHPVRVPHESVRKAADANVWPVPYQPLSVQVWDRSSTSDTLLGTARVPIMATLGNGGENDWYKLVGTGDQTGVEEVCGKIRVKVRWESEIMASTPEDKPRLFLRDVFGPEQKDYQHLYYGGLCSTMLCPPAGEERLLELMMGISRHDITANNHGKGVEGMLVLTELRLLFIPDIGVGSTTVSFLEFNTVQVYLAAVRNFSHRGVEGGDRLLSITTRDGRLVHFRMPAAVASVRCGAWFETECLQQDRRRWRGAEAGICGREELWKRGLWGAGSSELWMERLVDEIRWRKASGDFVALWHKLRETSTNLRATALTATTSLHAKAPILGGGGRNPVSSQYRHVVPVGAATTSSAAKLSEAATAAAAAAAESRGDLADGRAALERDLERMGVPRAGGYGASFAAFGRQMWEFKAVNNDYQLSPTYPKMLAFPSAITPAKLAMAAPQRSRSRVPALVWLHPTSKAPLCRSSQPMAGMTTKVLSDDIYLLKQIRVTLDAAKISIVDARSLLNAKANQVTGKGYEDVNDIGRDVCTLAFMGIENIHAVRDSLTAFCAASQAQGQEYYHAVGASGWLRHLSQIMKGAAFVVDELQRGVAVLVHCSDGWDRTAQLTALAQLYMDPFYRTLAGFEVLVEKEWCSFGHMFGLRAHSDSPTESSPVFLQWLDAVWQLVRQYPSSFEFTGHYLERLVEGLYSSGFINFAANCERERKEKLKELQETGSGALSLFSYLGEHMMEGHMTAPLLNPLYRPPHNNVGRSGRGPSLRAVDVLRPCCELQGLEIWKSVFMRDNLLLHHREKQMSVEQGLRLQVYDYQRRVDLIETSMDRLPRSLRAKLRSSTLGMNSPEWDCHDRMTAQLSADQDAAAAAAAASASSGGFASRGRSQHRTAGPGNNEEGSRSRSRSFTLPRRGWGGGKGAPDVSRAGRADTDIYRGNRVDTDIEEESYRTITESRAKISGGISSGIGQPTDEGKELAERPARNKGMFPGFGRWGQGRSRATSQSAVLPLPSPTVVGNSIHGGSGGRRRRYSSSAAADIRRAESQATNGRSPESGLAVTFDPLPQTIDKQVTRKEPSAIPEPPMSAKLFGSKKSWGRSRSTVVDPADDPEPRQRAQTASTGGGIYRGSPLAETPSRNRSTRGTPSRMWKRERGRASSSAVVGKDSEEDEPEAFRYSRCETDARPLAFANREDRGKPKKNILARPRGVWGSIQRTLNSGANKPAPAVPIESRIGLFPGRTAAAQTTAERLDGKGSATSSACSEKSTNSTGGDVALDDAASASAERAATRLKDEEEAEALRQMQRTIITLEMELLVNKLVDTAYLRAAGRHREKSSERSDDRFSVRSSRSPHKGAPLSVSSIAPASLPRLSATAGQPAQRTFFGNFWNGGGGAGDSIDVDNADGGLGGGEGGGGVGLIRGGIAGHWGGLDQDRARQRRYRSAAADYCHVDGKAGGGLDVEPAKDQAAREDGDEQKDESGGSKEEGGFFEVLRRIFEGDNKKRDNKTTAKATANEGVEMKEEATRRLSESTTLPETREVLKCTLVKATTVVGANGPKDSLRRRDAAPPDKKRDDKTADAMTSEREDAMTSEREEMKEEAALHLSRSTVMLPEMREVLKCTPVKATTVVGAVDPMNSSRSRKTASPGARGVQARSRSVAAAGAAAGAGAGAGRGTEGFFPVKTVTPIPLAVRSFSMSHPDAGAGGSRSVEPPKNLAPAAVKMAPEMAEEAAAKFGLVRMDYSRSSA